MVRQELAKERLAEYLFTSSIWDEEALNKLVRLKPHLSNNDLAKVFECGTSSVRKACRLYRHARGDFEDKRPEALQPGEIPPLELTNGRLRVPATATDKQDIWRMRAVDELSYQNIADITGYSTQACRTFYQKEALRREVRHDND